MKRKELKAYLNKNLTLRQISAESKKCLGSIRYYSLMLQLS